MATDEPGSRARALCAEELMRLDEDLAARSDSNPRPHRDLPEAPALGSNVEYMSREEHDRVMRFYAMNLQAFARQSGRVSEDDHRRALEQATRSSR